MVFPPDLLLDGPHGRRPPGHVHLFPPLLCRQRPRPGRGHLPLRSTLCVFSVDAMGLRPLWFGETEREYFISSEMGVVPHEEILSDPKPLAPGEKLGCAAARRGKDSRSSSTTASAGRKVILHSSAAAPAWLPAKKALARGEGVIQRDRGGRKSTSPGAKTLAPRRTSSRPWPGRRSDLRNLKDISRTGTEPIASLGYDGPLAARRFSRQNLSDYFKEQVAVVTNPAIDRERESEHFSPGVTLGARPRLAGGRSGRRWSCRYRSLPGGAAWGRRRGDAEAAEHPSEPARWSPYSPISGKKAALRYKCPSLHPGTEGNDPGGPQPVLQREAAPGRGPGAPPCSSSTTAAPSARGGAFSTRRWPLQAFIGPCGRSATRAGRACGGGPRWWCAPGRFRNLHDLIFPARHGGRRLLFLPPVGARFPGGGGRPGATPPPGSGDWKRSSPPWGPMK